MPSGRPQGTVKAQKDGAWSRKGKKVVRDPNAPKPSLTGYFMFMADERPKIIAKGRAGAVSAEIGSRWNKLDVAQKMKYQEKAAKDKARYEAEMKIYRKN